MKAVKLPKAPKAANPCLNAPLSKLPYASPWYGMRQGFTPSSYQLKKYGDFYGHKLVMNWDADPPAVTFDTDALRILRGRYPSDPVYKQLEDYRNLEKCVGTYIDGMPPAQDGCVHGTYTDFAATLRWSMQSPSLQVLPRPEKGNDGELPPMLSRVRDIFCAAPGHAYHARDFSGIESVLTYYLAGERGGMRLAGGNIQNVHGWIATHAIGKPIDLSWSDSDIKDALNEFQHENRVWKMASGQAKPFKEIRTGCKRASHLSNYGGTPARMTQAEPDLFPTKAVAEWFQRTYFEACPAVPKWQWAVCEEAAEKGYVTTPDGFRMWFFEPFDWSFSKRLKAAGKDPWVKRYSLQAKEIMAAKPQHLAAMYMALALDHLWREAPEHIKQGLRLTIHDEILGEWPVAQLAEADKWLMDSMERPCGWLPLPPEWEMGSHLAIKTSAKRGSEGGSWGVMLEV